MRYAALIITFSFAALAQITADGITTSVSRTVNITADEADFSLIVSAPLDTTQQQVTQAFLDAGIPNPTVVSVAAGQNNFTYPPSTDTQMFYQIAFSAAPAAITGFAKKLDALRANLPATLASVQYTAALNASQAAVDAAHQSVLAQLLADAKSKAQTLAAAASLTLGNIQGIGESSYASAGIVASIVSSLGSTTSSTGSAGGNGTQYTFYATVRFAAQ